VGLGYVTLRYSTLRYARLLTSSSTTQTDVSVKLTLVIKRYPILSRLGYRSS
jgi:hypothetical protein